MLSSLSVVIPAYNEQSRLPATLSRVLTYLRQHPEWRSEILVVDDGSCDATLRIAQRQAEALTGPSPSMRVLRNPGNRGKGYSVRHGMLEAQWEWILFTDADLSAPIEDCGKLVQAVSAEDPCIAIGSRALDRSLVGVHQSRFRESIGRGFNLMVRLVAGLPFKDTQCGFKLFSRQAARAIFALQRLDRFGFDVEVLYLAKKLGLPAVEVPVRWNDTAGTKVGMLAGANAFLDIARVRWNDWTGKYR